MTMKSKHNGNASWKVLKAGFTLRDNCTIVTIALVIEVAIIFTGNRCTERDVVHIARQF